MNNVTLRMAEQPDDFEAACKLCRDWLDWHWRHYPDAWPRGADHPMDPSKFEATLQDLPARHRRPQGGVIIGSVDGRDVGCVIYQRDGREAGVAEFNRMFVSEHGRGHGVGHRMLDYMFERLIEDGYRKLFFSSATFLTHARRMYEAAGFNGIPHPEGFPDEWREHVYFMERDLR